MPVSRPATLPSSRHTTCRCGAPLSLCVSGNSPPQRGQRERAIYGLLGRKLQGGTDHILTGSKAQMTSAMASVHLSVFSPCHAVPCPILGSRLVCCVGCVFRPALGGQAASARRRPSKVVPGAACLLMAFPTGVSALSLIGPAQVVPSLSRWPWPDAGSSPLPGSAFQLMGHHGAGAAPEAAQRKVGGAAVAWRRPWVGTSRHNRRLLPSLGLFCRLPSQCLCAREAKPACFGRKDVPASKHCEARRSVAVPVWRRHTWGCLSQARWWHSRQRWGVGHSCHVCVLSYLSCARPREERFSEAFSPRLLRGLPGAWQLCRARPPPG